MDRLPKAGDVYACEKCGMEMHCHVDCGCDDPKCVNLTCCGQPLTTKGKEVKTAKELASCANCAQAEADVRTAVANAHGSVVLMIRSHQGVAEAEAAALASGVSIWTILATILQFVTPIFTGGVVDWAGIIAAILALINPAPPPPLPGG